MRVLDELGVEHVSLRTMFNSLERCAGRDYRSRVAEACFAHASRAGDLSLVLYDVTTLYFEAENEDEYWGPNEGLRKPGFSKERRVDPQIMVGLLVNRNGFPLEVGCFEGNKAETLTILPIVQDFQTRHGIEGLVVVLAALRVARRFLDLGQSSKLLASRSSSRWHVEQSFRMSKADLRARPVFHHQKDAIEAHLTVVIAAFAVSRYLYQKTGITTKKLIQILKPLREISIRMPGGQETTAKPEITPETRKILESLKGH